MSGYLVHANINVSRFHCVEMCVASTQAHRRIAKALEVSITLSIFHCLNDTTRTTPQCQLATQALSIYSPRMVNTRVISTPPLVSASCSIQLQNLPHVVYLKAKHRPNVCIVHIRSSVDTVIAFIPGDKGIVRF